MIEMRAALTTQSHARMKIGLKESLGLNSRKSLVLIKLSPMPSLILGLRPGPMMRTQPNKNIGRRRLTSFGDIQTKKIPLLL